MMMNYRHQLLLVVMVMACIIGQSESDITPCEEYRIFTEPYYAVTYYQYTYSCGSWWSSSTCYSSATKSSVFYSNVTKLVCCEGYGGKDCEPICSTPCGINKECSLPENCTCQNGWEGDDCLIDIDECIEGTDECQYHNSCINIAGTYNCNCPIPNDKLGLDGLHCNKPVTDVRASPHNRDLVLYWSHPLQNGSFEIQCIADYENVSIPSVSNIVDWIDKFKVEPLTPFTTYTCSIVPVTVNGKGNPTEIEVKTLEDKPDGPPLGLEMNTVDSMVLQVNWAPPEIPNGIIEYYKMYVNFTNSTNLRKLKVDREYTTFYLEFLNPYQVVGVSVSAVTAGGEGPATSFVFNRTDEAEPGRVHDMTVSVTSENSAAVTWHPPRSLNGIVLSYSIHLYKITQGHKTLLSSWKREADEDLNVNVFHLEPYVPYEFVVIAITEVGEGEIAPYQFFTAETVPDVSPDVKEVSRISATVIFLEWDPLSEDQLQGVFTNYVVKYYTSAVHSDCSSPMDEQTLITTDEYTLLEGLDPHSAYCFKVAAATTVGLGSYSSFNYIDMHESSKFELHLKDVYDCRSYVSDENTRKISDIAEFLADICNNYCKCGIQDNHFGEMRFFCDKNDNGRVIFQGSLAGTPEYWSYELIKDLEQWKNSSPMIVVEGLQLLVDSTCDIAIEDFGSHVQCSVPIMRSSVKQHTASTRKMASTDGFNTASNVVISDAIVSNGNHYYAAGIFAIIGVGLIAAVAIIIVVLVLLRIRYLKKSMRRQTDTVRYDASTGGVTNPITDDDCNKNAAEFYQDN